MLLVKDRFFQNFRKFLIKTVCYNLHEGNDGLSIGHGMRQNFI